MNKLQQAVMVESSAEGHYSSSTDYQVVFLPVTVISQLEEVLEEFTFGVSELDGKHSYTPSDVRCLRNISDMLEMFKIETGSDCLTEELIFSFPHELHDELFAFDKEVKSKLNYEIISRTVYTYDGEEVS